MKNWGLPLIIVTLLVAMPTKIAAADFPALFDTIDYRNDSLAALPQWQRVLEEIASEQEAYSACADASGSCKPHALLAWHAVITGQRDQPSLAKVRAVNRFVNQWTPKSDMANHQKHDVWSSPLTFLRQSGDSEDYAIIKYVSLRQMGFAAEQLRIVVVRDFLRDQRHTILAVHIDGDIYILDNLFQAVLPQTKVRQYFPYYSVNEQARWTHLPIETISIASVLRPVMPFAVTSGEAS